MLGRLFVFVILILLIPAYSFAVDCADGYTENNNGLCVATCSPGYRVENAGEPCTQITGSVPIYTDTTHTVIYGETSGDNVKTCPAATVDHPCQQTQLHIPASVSHNGITRCICDSMVNRFEYNQGASNHYLPHTLATHGTAQTSCYYGCYNGECYYGATYCINSVKILTCDAGFYSVMGSQRIAGEMSVFGCMPVGVNYYSPDGDLDRYPCPENTVTAGYGENASGVDDCKPYKILHTGNVSTMMISTKETSPSLVIKTGNDLFYGATTTLTRTNTIKIRLPDNNVYSVVNPLDQFEHAIIPSTTRFHPFGPDDYEVIIVP